MIACDKATHTTNLYYSAIKFLRFEGIIWSGDHLPLQLNSIGELFQIQVSLRARDGEKSKAHWERGVLHADFVAGKPYDLDMRLEYCLPIRTHYFRPDFISIHPKEYLCAVDLNTSSLGQSYQEARVVLAEQEHPFTFEEESLTQELPAGQVVRINRRDDYVSLTVSAKAESPYAHRHFPEISLV